MTTKEDAKIDKDKTHTGDEAAPEVPAGFTQADTDVDNFPAWDFDKSGELRATVEKVKVIELIRRGEPVDVRMAVVTDADGELYCLWESANLANFFDGIRAGSEILVQPIGMQPMSGNRTMKLFRAYYK